MARGESRGAPGRREARLRLRLRGLRKVGGRQIKNGRLNHKGGHPSYKQKPYAYEKVLGENLMEISDDDGFYHLPTKNIIGIIKSSRIMDTAAYGARRNTKHIDIVKNIIRKLSQIRPDEAPLLLTTINFPDSTFEDCIEILKCFTSAPICSHLGELYDREKRLPDHNIEFDLRQKDLQIQNLKMEIMDLKSKLPLEKPYNFEPDIFKAAKEGKLKSVQYLIQNNANTDQQDEEGKTILHYAVKTNNYLLVEFLIEKGANSEIKDNDGKTPADYIVDQNIRHFLHKR